MTPPSMRGWVSGNSRSINPSIEKLASLCFESFSMVYERRKYCILLATPINTTHHVLSAHAHNLAQ